MHSPIFAQQQSTYVSTPLTIRNLDKVTQRPTPPTQHTQMLHFLLGVDLVSRAVRCQRSDSAQKIRPKVYRLGTIRSVHHWKEMSMFGRKRDNTKRTLHQKKCIPVHITQHSRSSQTTCTRVKCHLEVLWTRTCTENLSKRSPCRC